MNVNVISAYRNCALLAPNRRQKSEANEKSGTYLTPIRSSVDAAHKSHRVNDVKMFSKRRQISSLVVCVLDENNFGN